MKKLMKSFNKKYIDSLIIPHHIISMIRQIGEFKGKQDLYKQQKPEVLENLKKVAIIQSTESSNRIEGIIVDSKRIEAIVYENIIPENRSESEIAGYKDVLNIIHENNKNIFFTDKVILQLHRDLMKYSSKEGGKWKSVNNDITETLPNGTIKIRFKPVDAFNTPIFMEELHKEFNFLSNDQKVDHLILLSLYILDFLCIHPFLDGNGRMSRLLTVLLLYYQDYEVGKYISLEKIIENTKGVYYDTLYKASQNWHEGKHDAVPWIEYFLGTILAGYKEFEARITNDSTKQLNKTDLIINTIDNFIGNFTLNDIEKNCPDISIELIKKVLNKLKDESKLESVSKGRYSKWRKLY